MPSVSFHLNLETLKLLLSQSSCSQFFFIEEDFSLLRLPPHVGRYKFSVRGKVMKLQIYIYIFFQLISLHAFLLDGPFHFFLVIVVVFLLFFDSILYCLLK